MKTLNRLLIANRGEIAVRIARTARRLGITTIAVCSDADQHSPHVRACDSFVNIGGSAPAESYLRADRIVQAALDHGAHAIHPGYGFLSENAGFAAAVEAAGLIFVGPPASAVHAMGDKARARRRMALRGIPVIPGYDDDDQDEQRLIREAQRLGMPLMIKAAAGGGGRGMRLVTDSAEFGVALRSAASEAAKAFGDGRLILERALIEPRHVEVQVMADSHGRVIHLGERDCSVQRRHQKIIEEAPSPAVNADLRERMGQAAVAVAREIAYVGAGTVEFLLAQDGQFYFMEMNTRLQVEHPVTELITGLDLVELQLRVARGEPLSISQDDVRRNGHAIEARLCAEEPADDFVPRSGMVLDWNADDLVRCDHAVDTGIEVSPWYDSMTAKIIALGSTRAEALDRLAHALDRTTLLGVTTNRAFLARLLRHPEFADGARVSTAFIRQHFGEPSSRASIPQRSVWTLAAWLSVSSAIESQSVPAAWRGWNSGLPLPTPWRLRWLGPQSSTTDSESERSGHVVLGRNEHRVSWRTESTTIVGAAAPPRTWSQACIDGSDVIYRYVWGGTTLWLQTADGDFAFECRRRESAAAGGGSAGGAADIRASFSGRVIEVAVTTGQTVAVGQRLLVLEAMKMEQQVLSPSAGTVAQINIKVGDQVAPGQVLSRIEATACNQKS